MTAKTKTTTKKTTPASNNENATYFMKGANDLQSILNNHICNINKKRHSSHELYTPEEVIELIKKYNLVVTITALGKIHNLAIQQRVQELKTRLQEQDTTQEKTPRKKATAKKGGE